MSSTDQTKEDFLTPLETVQRTLRQQSRSPLMPDIKSSSLMRQTIPRPTYNSSLERLLRSSQETADLSSPAIIKIKSSSHSTPGVLWSSFPSKVKRNQRSKRSSLSDLTLSWTVNGAKVIRKFLSN